MVFAVIEHNLCEFFRLITRLDITCILNHIIYFLICSVCCIFSGYLLTCRLIGNCQELLNILFNFKDGLLITWNSLWRSLGKFRITIVCIWIALIVMNIFILPLFTRPGAPEFDVQMHRVFQEFDRPDDARMDRQMNDRQNVHDSIVTNYIIESTKRLGQLQRPFDQLRTEIESYLLLSNDTRAPDAIEVFHHICQTNMYHMGTNKTETELLGLVWQRITHPVNHEHVSDLKESLLYQLADCKEHEIIVCGVGRISRIIQTLECLDAEGIVNIHPTWSVSENIGDYVTKYIEKLSGQLPKQYKDAIDAVDRTPEQQQLAHQFYRCVKNNLEKKFKLMYLDTHLLTKAQLDKLSKEYMDQLE